MSKIHDCVRDIYAACYILTNVAHLVADDLYVGPAFVSNAKPPGRYATVEARKNGKTFLIYTDRLDPSEDAAFVEAWRAFADRQSTLSTHELDAIVDASPLWEHFYEICDGLRMKGFELYAHRRAVGQA